MLILINHVHQSTSVLLWSVTVECLADTMQRLIKVRFVSWRFGHHLERISATSRWLNTHVGQTQPIASLGTLASSWLLISSPTYLSSTPAQLEEKSRKVLKLRERQTDRQREGGREIERNRDRDRQTDGQTYRDTYRDRDTDRQTDRNRERHEERERLEGGGGEQTQRHKAYSNA